jgi:hypothetical protein
LPPGVGDQHQTRHTDQQDAEGDRIHSSIHKSHRIFFGVRRTVAAFGFLDFVKRGERRERRKSGDESPHSKVMQRAADHLLGAGGRRTIVTS